MTAHEHWNEEELIERLMNGSDADATELAACAECSAAARELEDFLGLCRDSLEVHVDPARVEALTDEVLALTTREDLGWRGDMRLVGGFVHSRMRASFFLRVAAASLVVHVTGVPLLAYLGFFNPPDNSFFIHTEQAAQPPFVDAPEEIDGELVPQEVYEAIELIENLGIEDVVGYARHNLQLGAPITDGNSEHRVGVILAARSALIMGDTVVTDAPASDASTVELALWCELQLDRYVLEGEKPALHTALAAIENSGAADRFETASSEERGLIFAARSRAHHYGLAPRPADPAEFSALMRPLRPGIPLDRLWIETLGRALDAAFPAGLRDDPVVSAWLRWGA
jgi:hypothetical protein